MTLHDPTADQRSAVKKYEKTTKIISFDEIRSLLFDAPSYIRTRSEKAFGSIYDYAHHTFQVSRKEFVEPTVISNDRNISLKITQITQQLLDGQRFIITAEYGVGKSMLLRELFFTLCEKYSSHTSLRIPLAINLRDHIGQDDPVELLERHARANAADPRKLVAAWSAGYLDILIDGFDKLSTRGWTGDHKKLREFRRSTHLVVKKLIRDTPRKAAIVIAGRDAYFDSEAELRESLGAPAGMFEHLTIQYFDEEQANSFLRKRGIAHELPTWIPARPLFLSYLINRNLLQETVNVVPQGAFPEGSAWASLLTMIAERESEQSEGVDKDAILLFLGAMATRARQTPTLQKSFSPSEMDELFYLVTGNNVSEDERRLLLRLPGLGVAPDVQSNRIFIDNDFLNAASGHLLSLHLKFPYGEEPFRKLLRSIQQQLTLIGLHVTCSQIESWSIPTGMINACLEQELQAENYALAYDIFTSSAFIRRFEREITFDGLDIQELDLCSDYMSGVNIKFMNCVITSLVMASTEIADSSVRFLDCLIGNIDGRASTKELSNEQFENCEIGHFIPSYSVNAAVLESSLPLGVRVLVVTLRKVFTQSGTSRLESALLRGLDHRARMIAPAVIDALVRNKFLSIFGRQGKTIYAGTRAMRKEALEIIQSPATNSHPVTAECRKLS